MPALPPTPTLLLELLDVFRQPDADVDQVVTLIAHEPAVTAEILKRCNSICFAGEEPTVDIAEAVSRVGFYEVYTLVASSFGAKVKNVPGAFAVLDMEAFWRHSVAVAVAAAAIAEEVGQARAPAFTTGLLHDVGRLVFAAVEPQRYAQLLNMLPANQTGIVAAERTVFGTDHAELGGELMAQWNLPAEVAQCVRFHHHAAEAPSGRRSAAVLQLADAIGHNLEAPNPADSLWMRSASPSMQTLGLEADDVQRLIAETVLGMEKVKGLLQM